MARALALLVLVRARRARRLHGAAVARVARGTRRALSVACGGGRGHLPLANGTVEHARTLAVRLARRGLGLPLVLCACRVGSTCAIRCERSGHRLILVPFAYCGFVARRVGDARARRERKGGDGALGVRGAGVGGGEGACGTERTGVLTRLAVAARALHARAASGAATARANEAGGAVVTRIASSLTGERLKREGGATVARAIAAVPRRARLALAV
ncbi:MAG: hypothetical protein CMK50_03030 [Propionibacteriaceae bacterium]|nr:hypothetical protein [Propionibacteriaceae bacterium]